MSKGNARKRQKKLEKAKKKRALVRRENQRKAEANSPAGLVRRAREAPFGPAWVSESLDAGAWPPALVSAVITRRVSGLLLPEIFLVDRTCLGVKNAGVLTPMTEAELGDMVATAEERGEPLRPCEPLVVQSLVFHALDYARGLGFEPHRDFRPALLEPRPETLLEPTLSQARPYYVSGPRDDVPRILAQLERAVGARNYDFVAHAQSFGLGDWLDEDWEDEEDWEEEDGELEVEGSDPRTGVVETTGLP